MQKQLFEQGQKDVEFQKLKVKEKKTKLEEEYYKEATQLKVIN